MIHKTQCRHSLRAPYQQTPSDRNCASCRFLNAATWRDGYASCSCDQDQMIGWTIGFSVSMKDINPLQQALGFNHTSHILAMTLIGSYIYFIPHVFYSESLFSRQCSKHPPRNRTDRPNYPEHHTTAHTPPYQEQAPARSYHDAKPTTSICSSQSAVLTFFLLKFTP